MHFYTQKNNLLNSLSHVQGGIERRSTIRILENVKIETKQDSIKLTTTDLDLVIEEEIQVGIRVEEQGAVTVSASLLHDIFKKMPDLCEIEIKVNNDKLEIKANNNIDFSLAILPVGEFPVDSGDGVEFLYQFKMKVVDLKGWIDSVKFAMSMEETRYYLNGIYLYHALKDDVDVIRVVATDGHRLAEVEAPVPGKGAIDIPGMIIHRKTINVIHKIIERMNEEEELEIFISDNKIKLELGAVTVISKLIDGTYPDYEKVIPLNNDIEVKVKRKNLVEAIDRIATVSSSKSKIICLEIKDKKIFLSASNVDSSEATEVVDLEECDSNICLHFNYKFLLELLQSLKGDITIMKFLSKHPLSPVLVIDNDNQTARFVIMPINKDV